MNIQRVGVNKQLTGYNLNNHIENGKSNGGNIG